MLKRFNYNSPVILTLTFLALGVVAIHEHVGNYFTIRFFSVYRSSLMDPFFYIRLFGHVLGHANWAHYINNFLLILILGPMLEEKYGSKKLLGMIAVTALVTGLLNVILFNSGLLGASGVVFMLILLSSFVNIQKGTIPVTLILVVIIYMGSEIINGVFVKDNISQLTHLIGGICGCVFGFKGKG